MFDIISYESKYHSDFRRLNLEWLESYNLTESHDLELLDYPEEKIIATGGCLFLAMDDDKVIGTAGLLKEREGEFELVKMSVDPDYRGQGIGKQLLERCLAEAKMRGGVKIFLFSNSQLQTAIKMYEKFGFNHVAVTGTPLLTADVKMELNLV